MKFAKTAADQLFFPRYMKDLNFTGGYFISLRDDGGI